MQSNWSIRTRTSTPLRRPRPHWPTSWAITITPSWPIRPACRERESKSLAWPRKRKSGGWSSIWARSKTRSSRAGSSRWCKLSSALARTPSRRPTGSSSTIDSAAVMQSPDWARRVMEISKLKAVFLTNDFDDPLSGFDASLFVPCLRTDDLVFHLSNEAVRGRLAKATGVSGGDAKSLRSRDRQIVRALRQPRGQGMRHLAAARLRSCAIEATTADAAVSEVYAFRRRRRCCADSARRACSCFGRWPSSARSSSCRLT